MPRVFWPQAVQTGVVIEVAGDTGHHFARVLRAAAGESLTVAADGRSFLAKILHADAKLGSIEVEIGRALPSADPIHQVYLVQGIAKGDKIDHIIQSCTQLGVAGVVVYAAARSVVKLDVKPDKLRAKVNRWRKIAEEAASQSQRDSVPEVWAFRTAQELVEWAQNMPAHQTLLLDEAEQTMSLRQALRGGSNASGEVDKVENKNKQSQAVTMFAVGPEGGWSDEERMMWLEHFGATCVTLGRRILRTETAGLVAATAILFERGDLGG